MSHIDPATGRNKRETGKLAKRMVRDDGGSGAIRRRDGKPVEKRIDQKRRNATRGRAR